jgi:hypothetical protein
MVYRFVDAIQNAILEQKLTKKPLEKRQDLIDLNDLLAQSEAIIADAESTVAYLKGKGSYTDSMSVLMKMIDAQKKHITTMLEIKRKIKST